MFNVVCDRISLETYGVFYVTQVLIWIQSGGHEECYEIACHVLFSIVIHLLCISMWQTQLSQIWQSMSISFESESPGYQLKRFIKRLSSFSLPTILCFSNLKCIWSLDTIDSKQVKLDHELLGLSSFVNWLFISTIHSNM